MNKNNQPYKIWGIPLFPLIRLVLLILFVIFSFPIINHILWGKFTWNFYEAIDFYQLKQIREMNCEWGAICNKLGSCYCESPLCKKYNIADYKCVREGYTGEGFLGLGDYHTEYYVCEGLGRIALSCSEYWNKEDFEKHMNDMSNENLNKTK
jgi:hypothetical protein